MFSADEKIILNKISHTNNCNESYMLPTEIDKSQKPFYQKPLIKNKNNYILIDKCYCSWNFYEVIPYLLEYKYIDIGKNLENLIIDELKSSGATIHFGNYQSSDRECDIVIEENDKIIFIEIKKKSLTRKSISGDETQIAIDLIDAFMHSQEQLLTHEVFIKKHNKIIFDNGTELELNDRTIEKVSISLFDSYSLNDHLFTMNMFDYLQRVRLNIKYSEDQKIDNQLKKSIQSIQEKNQKILNIVDIMNELYSSNPDEYRKDRFNIWFFSMELFIMIISRAKYTNTSISKVMNTFKHMSALTGDLYYEFDSFSSFKS
jgi:Holliday junction resolvase-like predicted endonuclease